MDIKKTTGDNFYKRVGSSRSEVRQSQSNFYFSSNKSETYSTLIQMLKSDLLTIQDMINSNSNDIKMYKLLSKNPGLTKKLSEIDDARNISIFIDKITEQSGNIEIISKIYGTKNENECIQKLFLESNLSDLFLKKVSDYFTLIKLKLYNDSLYQDSLSKVISIREFIEKIPSKINNNINSNINKNPISIKNEGNKSEIDDFLKINTLNELLDYNLKNKKICPHVAKLVQSYFNNLNLNLIEIINKFDNEKKNLDALNNFKGTDVEKFFKLKDIYNEILINLNSKNEELINNKKDVSNLNNEIYILNEKYDKEIQNLNEKLNNLLKENEDLKGDLNSNSDLKYTSKDIDELKNKSLEEKRIMDESYKNKIESLNKDIKNLNEKISKLEKICKEKEKENNNKEKINKENNNQFIPKKLEKIDIMEFVKKHNIEFTKNQKESNIKLDNNIRNLNQRIDQLNEQINILKLEKSDLKKKYDIIQGKNMSSDSYEKILLHQFDMMKNAFSKKVDEMTNQLNEIQIDSRKKIYELEQELKESERLKEVFLQQIVFLQEQLGI